VLPRFNVVSVVFFKDISNQGIVTLTYNLSRSSKVKPMGLLCNLPSVQRRNCYRFWHMRYQIFQSFCHRFWDISSQNSDCWPFNLGRANPWAKGHQKGRWPTVHLDLPSHKISARSPKRSTRYALPKFFTFWPRGTNLWSKVHQKGRWPGGIIEALLVSF